MSQATEQLLILVNFQNQATSVQADASFATVVSDNVGSVTRAGSLITMQPYQALVLAN